MAAVTNLLWLNSYALPQGIVTGDTVTAPGDWTFTQNVAINGNLTVTGSITSGSTLNSVSRDAFIDLGFGYLLNTANQPGGFTLDTRLAAGFVPGDVTSFPSLTSFVYTDTGGCTTLAAGDVVMLTNLPPAFQANEGYYIVQTVSSPAFPQTVTIYNVSQSGTPWANTSFTTTGAVAPPGNAAKINLAVVAVADGTSQFSDADGVPWPVGTVLSAYVTNATLAQFQVNGVYNAIGNTSLQRAYDNGNTISTDGGLPIAFTVSDGNFTVDGTGLIDFSVDTSIALQAPTLNIGTDAAGTTANATINLGSSTTTALTLSLADNQASVFTLAQGPNTYIDVTTTNGAETLDLGAPGVNATVNVNSGTGTLNVGTTASARNVNLGTGAAAQVVTIGESTTAGSYIDLYGGSINGVRINNNANSPTTINANSTNGVSILVGTATGGFDLATSTGAQTINIGTGAAPKTITLGSTDTTSSLSLTSGTGDTSIDSTGHTIISSTGFVFFDQSAMFRNTFVGTGVLADVALVAGEVLAIESTTNPTSTTEPRVTKANAAAVDVSERRFFGIVVSPAVGAGASGFAATVSGLCVPVLFDPAGVPTAAAQNGDPVFVALVAGRATMNAPTGPTQTVMQIGQLVSAAAVAANTYSVYLAPQYIGLIP